jgi:hypothetical protein
MSSATVEAFKGLNLVKVASHEKYKNTVLDRVNYKAVDIDI